MAASGMATMATMAHTGITAGTCMGFPVSTASRTALGRAFGKHSNQKDILVESSRRFRSTHADNV